MSFSRTAGALALAATTTMTSCPETPTRTPTDHVLVDALTGTVLGQYLSDETIACIDNTTCMDFADDLTGHGIKLLYENALCFGPPYITDETFAPAQFSGHLQPATALISASGQVLRYTTAIKNFAPRSASIYTRAANGVLYWACETYTESQPAIAAFPLVEVLPPGSLKRLPRERLAIR